MFSSCGKSVPKEEWFSLKSPLTFYFYFIKGKIKQEQKPLLIQVGKNQSAKHESWSGDQVTYWEGTSCEVAPL